MKIFSVGNSYAHNAHTFLLEIAADAGVELTLLNAMIGGCSLERHVRHAKAYDKNKNDPEGSPYPVGFFKPHGCKISLRQCLQLKDWDVVTIHQASCYSFIPESYHPHAEELIKYIRRWAPKAEIVIHETWAYRDDHPFNRSEWNGAHVDTDIMYKGLKACYYKLAAETGFRLIPSGDAMQKARLSKRWGMPVTEQRSLHSGDSLHLNDNGCYLAGLVWAETLLGVDARKVKFRPDGMNEDDAKILRSIAHQTAGVAK